MAHGVEARLEATGVSLPPTSSTNANYVACRQAGDLLFVSGIGWPSDISQTPLGKVGAEVTTEAAYGHAREAGRLLLSHVRDYLGTLDRVSHVVKVFGMVNSTPDFIKIAQVMNGASDLLVEVFEEEGRHTRSAVGMTSLPFGFTVEVEAVLAVTTEIPGPST